MLQQYAGLCVTVEQIKLNGVPDFSDNPKSSRRTVSQV